MKSSNLRGTPTGRELCFALLVALAVFAWPLRQGLFDPSRILCGVDTASSQLPWSAAPGGSDQVANRELADQGMVFYPACRFALNEWSGGGPPLWNPWIYAGAPAIGNPQLGLLDPQVWLQVALGRLFGLAAFDWSFAFLLWLRLALAAAGAFALARRLGLGRSGASLAAVGFCSAGFLALWANHSLGHVAFFLPWVLFALEGLRGPRPARAFVAAAVLLALAILGGHPETAFNLGLAAGLWSLAMLREDRRTGAAALGALSCGTLLAAPCLVPFIEYLQNSGALIARRGLPAAGEPDWLALGLGLLALGIAWRWRELSGARSAASGLPASIGVGTAIAACLALLVLRDLSPAARLFLWPDAAGHAGAYRGEGLFLEEASVWLAAPVAVLALAALLTPAASSALRRRNLCSLLGVLALALALRAPGWTELYRHLPLIGLAATVRFALLAALFLSLLAGEALERAPRSARVAAMSAFGVLALLALGRAPLAGIPAGEDGTDPPDGVVEFIERPGQDPDQARLSGWIHPGLAVGGAELRVETLSRDGASNTLPIELSRAAWSKVAGAPEGATYFRASGLWLHHLQRGHWRFTLRLFDAQGALLGERIAAVTSFERPLRATPVTIVFWVLAMLFVFGLKPGVATWCTIVFAALQGLSFLGGIHPAIARDRALPLTSTERILARELGSRRYLAEPGVLPANTGMLRGLRALDGYDGLDPASFDGYRSAVLRPGVQPLLGFSARHVEYGSAAFRLLGVGALVLAAPIEAAGFELIAAPDGSAAATAECWIYRAVDPLPRAFCVPRTRPREEVLADLAAFDPLACAFLEDGARFETEAPFTRSSVREIAWRNDSVELEVELDGQGLLVLTEQHFPGWRVEVAGVERELLRADSIFRAVALPAGTSRVTFRYAPASWSLGLWLCGLGLGLGAAAAWRMSRSGRPRS